MPMLKSNPSALQANVNIRKEATEIIELIGDKPPRFWEVLIELAKAKLPGKPTPAPVSKPNTTARKPVRRHPISEVQEAIEICEEIYSLVDEVPEQGEEFAESVRERASDIQETIERMDHVTDNQMTALENMRDGLSRWIK